MVGKCIAQTNQAEITSVRYNAESMHDFPLCGDMACGQTSKPESPRTQYKYHHHQFKHNNKINKHVQKYQWESLLLYARSAHLLSSFLSRDVVVSDETITLKYRPHKSWQWMKCIDLCCNFCFNLKQRMAALHIYDERCVSPSEIVNNSYIHLCRKCGHCMTIQSNLKQNIKRACHFSCWCIIFQASVNWCALPHFVENTLPHDATAKPEDKTS